MRCVEDAAHRTAYHEHPKRPALFGLGRRDALMKQNKQVLDVATLHPRVGASFALIPITIGLEIFLLLSAQFGQSTFWGLDGFGLIMLLGLVPVVVFYGGSLLIWCPAVQWSRRKALGTAYTSVGLALAVIGAGYAGAMVDPGGPGVAIYSMLAAGC